jgi:hypothetical protein
MSVSRARRNKHKRLPTVGRIVPIVAIRNRVYRELEVIAPANRPRKRGQLALTQGPHAELQ